MRIHHRTQAFCLPNGQAHHSCHLIARYLHCNPFLRVLNRLLDTHIDADLDKLVLFTPRTRVLLRGGGGLHRR